MLSKAYPVDLLCSAMEMSRAGYYKWLKRGESAHSSGRKAVVAAVRKAHDGHPSHGYRWVAAFISANPADFGAVRISANYCYKAFRFLGIESETRHKPHYRPRKERDRYPNLVFSNWDLVDRPRQVIVSDMTAFSFSWLYFEVTFYFDAFTKQILSRRIAERRGDRDQYIGGLEDVIKLLEGLSGEPTILHTDQGSVYASLAYNELIKDKNIVRSMPRAGKPTDNPVNESLNGWVKEELTVDFALAKTVLDAPYGEARETFIGIIDGYISFYNSKRPCWAPGYDTPDHFYSSFVAGDMEKKDVFSKRVLDPTPKFVKERLSTSGNGKHDIQSGLSAPEKGETGKTK